MRLILLSLLTLVLVGCGEIGLELGSDDTSGEVGQWVFEPSPNDNDAGWLLDTKTGRLRWCFHTLGGSSGCDGVFYAGLGPGGLRTADEIREALEEARLRQADELTGVDN